MVRVSTRAGALGLGVLPNIALPWTKAAQQWLLIYIHVAANAAASIPALLKSPVQVLWPLLQQPLQLDVAHSEGHWHCTRWHQRGGGRWPHARGGGRGEHG